MFRFLELNVELRRLTDNAERDLNVFKKLISDITKNKNILKRSFENEIEIIPKKDIEIKEIEQKASELEKEINVRNENIANLEEFSESLTSEIKNTKNMIEQVITNFYISKSL